ncbi:MAG: hypothetical protein ACYTBJ_10805 [Planctomycetota bacterium]
MAPSKDKKGRSFRLVFPMVLVVLAHSVGCPAQDTAADANQLLLTVNVTNGTRDGQTVAGDRIALAVYEHGELVSTFNGEVGPDGAATFEGMRSGEHAVAVAAVFHQTMSFSSDNIMLKPGTRQVNAQVRVFDVSYENSRLSVTTHHLIIKPTDTSLLLTEFIELVNPLDMAITSSQRDEHGKAVVLNVPLPRGFRNFSSSGYFVQQALVFTEEGFYDTMGVPPGSHQIIFSYTLDMTSGKIDITRRLSLPTDNFVLFSQLGRGKIEGLGDEDGQMVMTDGTLGEYYNLGSLRAGAKVRFRVAGLHTVGGDKVSWIILALVFGAITIVAFFRLWLTKNQPEKTILNSRRQ